VVVENQLRRQRHLAAACKQLGLGHQAPNFKTSDMYVNDTLKYIYCVVNKVIDSLISCFTYVSYISYIRPIPQFLTI